VDESRDKLGFVYVDSDCCTNCGVPWHVAPEVFAKGRDVCYVKKQPHNSTELRKVLRVFRQQEMGCVRYAGNNERMISILRRVGEGASCDLDAPPRAGFEAQTRPQPSVDSAASTPVRPWWRRLLSKLSNREHPLQVSGDIVNTSPSGTKAP
jgi:hypothetical protein